MKNRKWFFDYLPKIKEILKSEYESEITVYQLYDGHRYLENKICIRKKDSRPELIIIEITKRQEDILIYKLQKE